MTLYGRLVEPLEVGKISNNNIIHSFVIGGFNVRTCMCMYTSS
jgi:hypothetical protein